MSPNHSLDSILKNRFVWKSRTYAGTWQPIRFYLFLTFTRVPPQQKNKSSFLFLQSAYFYSIEPTFFITAPGWPLQTYFQFYILQKLIRVLQFYDDNFTTDSNSLSCLKMSEGNFTNQKCRHTGSLAILLVRTPGDMGTLIQTSSLYK